HRGLRRGLDRPHPHHGPPEPRLRPRGQPDRPRARPAHRLRRRSEQAGHGQGGPAARAEDRGRRGVRHDAARLRSPHPRALPRYDRPPADAGARGHPAPLLAPQRGVPAQRGAGHEHPRGHPRAHAEGGLGGEGAGRRRRNRPGGDARGPRARPGRLRDAPVQQSGPGRSRDRGAALTFRSKLPRLPLVLVAVAGALSAAAQSQTPTFPVDVDVVHVTATVRDGKGELVANLGLEDFELFEDGRPQKLTLFAPASQSGDTDKESDALGLNLGMLLDTSESMKEQIKLSQDTAIHFLESIPRARDLLLIFFDQDIRLSRYSSENQQGLFERILEAKGKGNTALYDAISVYISRVAGSGGRKVLLVFTDGEDSTSAIGLMDVINLVRSSGVTIYPISFAGGSFGIGNNRFLSAKAFLSQLADASGGTVFAPTASKELSTVYTKILDELQSQYV